MALCICSSSMYAKMAVSRSPFGSIGPSSDIVSGLLPFSTRRIVTACRRLHLAIANFQTLDADQCERTKECAYDIYLRRDLHPSTNPQQGRVNSPSTKVPVTGLCVTCARLD